MPCPRRGQHGLPEQRRLPGQHRPSEQIRLREQHRPRGLLQQSEQLQRRGQRPERSGRPDRKQVRGGKPVRDRTPRQAPLRQRPCKLDSARAAPVRTCIGCGARAAKHDLIRLVAAGDQIVPDITARQPGRGAYLHPSLACLERAQRRKAFSRALRLPAPLPASKVTDYLSGE
ncbi:MAG TPA: YlxR family protein [Streptosporangiaceae bacterium]|nr:YlxR family protein [Streptosporangiaceae bacterium]